MLVLALLTLIFGLPVAWCLMHPPHHHAWGPPLPYVWRLDPAGLVVSTAARRCRTCGALSTQPVGAGWQIASTYTWNNS